MKKEKENGKTGVPPQKHTNVSCRIVVFVPFIRKPAILLDSTSCPETTLEQKAAPLGSHPLNVSTTTLPIANFCTHPRMTQQRIQNTLPDNSIAQDNQSFWRQMFKSQMLWSILFGQI
jgi:hypothetical protein